MYQPYKKSKNHDAEYYKAHNSVFKVMSRHIPRMVKELGDEQGFDKWLNHEVAQEAEEIAVEYLEKMGWTKIFPRNPTEEYPGGFLYYKMSEWTAYWEFNIAHEEALKIDRAKSNNKKSVAKRRSKAIALKTRAILLKAQGISITEISKKLGRSRETIYQYLN